MENEMFAEKTNLLNEAESLADYWSPRVVGEVNDQYVKVAKLKGEFVWHQHDEEDELFYILRGTLEMAYRDKTVVLREGDMHVVARGVQHNPRAEEECLIALIETKTTLHTGDVVTEKTRSLDEQLTG